MSSITVNPLFTTNTAPTVTGSVTLNRKKGDTINVRLNYELYKLFEGNLGLEEFPVSRDVTDDDTSVTGTWKLQLSDPIEPGVYDVEAYVIDKDGVIIASDNTENEITIYIDPIQASTPPKTLRDKVNKLNALIAAFNMLSMATQAAFNSKGVHPVTSDDSSTHLHARGSEEGDKSAERKDFKAKKVKRVPRPNPAKNQATKTDAPSPWDETGESYTPTPPTERPGMFDNVFSSTGDQNPDSAGQTLNDAMEAVKSAPDLTRDLIQSNPGGTVTPTTPLG